MELSSTCKRFLAALASVVVIGAIGVGVLSSSSIPESEAEEVVAVTTESNYVDMTELSYLTDGSFNGWSGHSIQINKNQELGALSLRSDGVLRTYQKGVSVHAKGQVTYDISEYSADYTRFVAKVGVDGSRGSNGSIWYQFFASHDGSSWESLLKTDVMTGMTDAFPVDLDVEGYSYLRIYVDPNGSNAADHGTIGAPKLAKADYVDNEISYPRISKVDVYDEEISSHDASYNYENNLSLVREREIVNKIGYWTIQDAVSERPDIGVTLDWILDNEQVSEDVVEVGNLTRTSVFLEVLADLRSTHAADLSDPDYGDVYRRMMIALAAAYSSDTVSSPLVYGHTTANYDYIARYERVKQLFLEGKFSHPDWFCEYHVELMRLLTQDSLRDDETMWFSNYVRVVKKGATGPYSYMGYVKGNFILPAYFDEANREKYDTLYGLSAFDVPYGDSPNARYWMVFNHGGICWNLARTGQSVQKTLGMPSTGLFQPSHEAFLLYTKDAQGRPFWYVGNNNYGWGRSSTTWYV